MAGAYPMWWMNREAGLKRAAEPPGAGELGDLLRRIQSADGETLLLLFLLILLWHEDADKPLLLALAYIIL